MLAVSDSVSLLLSHLTLQSLLERGLSGEVSNETASAVSSSPAPGEHSGRAFIESLSLQYGEMPLPTWMHLLRDLVSIDKLKRGQCMSLSAASAILRQTCSQPLAATCDTQYAISVISAAAAESCW